MEAAIKKIPYGMTDFESIIRDGYYYVDKTQYLSLIHIFEITDSIIYADNQSKILNIESKYNHLKISKEVDRLKIKQQSLSLIHIYPKSLYSSMFQSGEGGECHV